MFSCLLLSLVSVLAPAKPNVVLVITDDQGYGDLGCHGNTMIKTPNLDRLHGQSVRLTNFHVDPTCSPTRAALATGRYSIRTGIWHTIGGRSLLRRDEMTMAEVFAASGYRTGQFGKWHLGDNYPYRPGERGFHESLRLGGGGVSQTPDFWGNDYFDDRYRHNEELKPFTGYCTDVFFSAAIDFVERNKDRPFFAYLATNAPHAPYLVDEKYSKPYRDQGVPDPMANFYGMIANIDENMGRLLGRLKDLGLEENTIVIFMTDNGTAAGIAPPRAEAAWKGHSAGMRAQKGSEYDGGHRVPCFLRWPAGKLGGAKDITTLTAHIDLLPTLIDLCQLTPPREVAFDGRSLRPLFEGQSNWPERTICVDSQRIEHPEKWRKCAVMTETFRLINGVELYNIKSDPGQTRDIAKDDPQTVQLMRRAYEKWWMSVSNRFDEYCPIVVGSDKENPTSLCCHDWHGPVAPSSQSMLDKLPDANGFWVIEVAQPGRYSVTLRQLPDVANQPIQAEWARADIEALEAFLNKLSQGKTPKEQKEAAPLRTERTYFRHTGWVEGNQFSFEEQLPAGQFSLKTWLYDGDRTRGAYYVEVKRLD